MIDVKQLCLQQGRFRLQQVDLTIPAAHYAVLMGRSGCGKTSVIEAICGLRPVESGKIHLAGHDVTHRKPAERNVGYVPQDRALFPTLRVRHQLAFSLMIRKHSPKAIAERVDELAALLGIESLLNRMPQGLSGGEAQRVALGRALASRPPVLLLDEPLSALDEELHEDMCGLLTRIHQHTQATVLHITHSRQEARRLGNVHFRMDEGKIAPFTLAPTGSTPP